MGIVKWHPLKGTHWIAYTSEIFCDIYGCAPLKKLSNFIIKRNGYCVYSGNKTQNPDSYCASFCLWFTWQ